MENDATIPFRPLDVMGVQAKNRAPSVFTTLDITKPAKTRPFDFNQGPRGLFDFLPPQKSMTAVTASGKQMVVEAPPYWQLPSATRRQFLFLLSIAGVAAAYAYLKSITSALPQAPAAVPQPPSIESPPQNPVTSAAGAATAGEMKNPPAAVENIPRFDRAYTIVQPSKEIASVIPSNFFPDYMLSPTALSETRLHIMTGEPIVRNSLHLAPSNNPNDRSLVDYIGDRFDDPSHGFMQNGKLQNYPPPRELPDGTKEYTLLDEKGPTVVDWMWFTNKNYQDHYAAMGNIRIYVDNNLAICLLESSSEPKDFHRCRDIHGHSIKQTQREVIILSMGVRLSVFALRRNLSGLISAA